MRSLMTVRRRKRRRMTRRWQQCSLAAECHHCLQLAATAGVFVATLTPPLPPSLLPPLVAEVADAATVVPTAAATAAATAGLGVVLAALGVAQPRRSLAQRQRQLSSAMALQLLDVPPCLHHTCAQCRVLALAGVVRRGGLSSVAAAVAAVAAARRL